MTEVVPGAEHVPQPALAYAEVRSRGWRGRLALFGPAFVASIAYLDPGNFATNIAGGSKYGYLLLWVLAMANLMGMLVQTMSAKIGIATGKLHARGPVGLEQLTTFKYQVRGTGQVRP